jgi:hypothetical protein
VVSAWIACLVHACADLPLWCCSCCSTCAVSWRSCSNAVV